MKRLNWWLYTVIIGALPLLIRFFIYLMVNDVNASYILNITDLVAFGLVLCIGNLKELEVQNDMRHDLKEGIKFAQLLLIILMSCFMWASYYMDLVTGSRLSERNILYCTLGLTFICFLSSLAVYYNPKYKNDEA